MKAENLEICFNKEIFERIKGSNAQQKPGQFIGRSCTDGCLTLARIAG
jgi:hypothetical protein